MNSGRTSAAEIRARPGCLHKGGFGEVLTHTRRSGAGDIYQNCMLGSIRLYGPMQEAWCGAVGGGGGNVVKFSLPCGAWSSSWRVYLGGLSSALAGIQGRAEKLKRFCFLIPDRLVTSASIFAVSIRMNASHESSNLLSLALCRSCPPSSSAAGGGAAGGAMGGGDSYLPKGTTGRDRTTGSLSAASKGSLNPVTSGNLQRGKKSCNFISSPRSVMICHRSFARLVSSGGWAEKTTI